MKENRLKYVWAYGVFRSVSPPGENVKCDTRMQLNALDVFIAGETGHTLRLVFHPTQPTDSVLRS